MNLVPAFVQCLLLEVVACFNCFVEILYIFQILLLLCRLRADVFSCFVIALFKSFMRSVDVFHFNVVLSNFPCGLFVYFIFLHMGKSSLRS